MGELLPRVAAGAAVAFHRRVALHLHHAARLRGRLRPTGSAALQSDRSGATALMVACDQGRRAAAVQVLLQWGARTDLLSDSGKTALVFTGLYGYETIARCPLPAGGRGFRRG